MALPQPQEQSQSFTIVAPKAKRALNLRLSYHDFLMGTAAEVVTRALAVPIRSKDTKGIHRRASDQPEESEDDEPEPPSDIKFRKADMSLGTGLANMPPEVVQMILRQVDNIPDIACFGLTNRYYWPFARRAIDDFYMSFVGFLAGKELVCVGDLVEPDDYPPGMFTEEEREQLRKKTYTPKKDMEEEEYESIPMLPEPAAAASDQCMPWTLHHFTKRDVSRVDRLKTLGYYSMEQYYGVTFRVTQDECKRLNDSIAIVSVSEGRFHPVKKKWILRNLTTREFVRAEGLAFEPSDIVGPHLWRLGFGHVVLSRICWTSKASLDMVDENTQELYRGPWAGHRFDIVPMSLHELKSKDQEWNDVTDREVEHLRTIWEREARAGGFFDTSLPFQQWFSRFHVLTPGYRRLVIT